MPPHQRRERGRLAARGVAPQQLGVGRPAGVAGAARRRRCWTTGACGAAPWRSFPSGGGAFPYSSCCGAEITLFSAACRRLRGGGAGKEGAGVRAAGSGWLRCGCRRRPACWPTGACAVAAVLQVARAGGRRYSRPGTSPPSPSSPRSSCWPRSTACSATACPAAGCWSRRRPGRCWPSPPAPLGVPWLACLGWRRSGAAVYSPARFAVLPAAAADTRLPLPRVNGWVELGAAAAIVGGVLAGRRGRRPGRRRARPGARRAPRARRAVPGDRAAGPLPFRRVRPEPWAGRWSTSSATPAASSATARRPRASSAWPRSRPSSPPARRRPRRPDRPARRLAAAAAGAGPDRRRCGAGLCLAAAAESPAPQPGLRPPGGHRAAAAPWRGPRPPPAAGILPLLPCLLLGFFGGLVNVPLRSAYLAAVPADARGNAMSVMNTAVYVVTSLPAAALFGLIARRGAGRAGRAARLPRRPGGGRGRGGVAAAVRAGGESWRSSGWCRRCTACGRTARGWGCSRRAARCWWSPTTRRTSTRSGSPSSCRGRSGR